MPKVQFEDTLPYTAQRLYDLVMDIERYPDIFPEIRQVKVRPGSGGGKNVEVVVSGPLFQSLRYTCDVNGIAPGQVDIRATAGDFKSMTAQWRFTPQPGGGTKVQYSMDFDFGGFGLKNIVAKELINGNVAQMRSSLRQYAAGKLKPETATNQGQAPQTNDKGGPSWAN